GSRPRAPRPSDPTPLAELARPPRPPDGLRALLRRHYPARARAVGAEGHARVRIRVSRDGEVRVLGALPGASPLFTDACRRALEEAAPFTPGLDRRGRRVVTVLPFRCTFTTVY
ncbi:MAG TPA: energy transducer TonB, partial [Sandaracinaceae bacterium LLY-WYZ-13_1]|nr:energy transducer TonB [Sandaracinaceae bacterium LLY-WYZ-13_1]